MPSRRKLASVIPVDVPTDFERDPDVFAITDRLRQRDRTPIFITGKAGTGKSTLVRYIRSSPDFPGAVVVAPTGIAAINVSGQTIHSFFRLPPRILTPDLLDEQRRNRLWSKVKLLIVDEVSMVRCDIIDAMDYILRRERRNDHPFGGVQVLFVGDFYQLPPVVPQREAEVLSMMGYEGPFAYNAHVFAECPPRRLELTQVHRQSDPEFLRLLQNLRLGQDVLASLETLNARCFGPHRDRATPLLLCGTNATASQHNLRGLMALTDPLANYTGIATGQFNLSSDKLPVPEKLQLRVGARVMAVKNDQNKAWFNGSIGAVTSVQSDGVVVKFDHSGREGRVTPAVWENVRYKWDERTGQPVAEVVGTYTQIPLILAWAVTIHKAQGLTLDDVRIDLQRGAFSEGQTYVALSRARTLEGLSLSRPLTPADIRVERRHGDFFGEAPPPEGLFG